MHDPEMKPVKECEPDDPMELVGMVFPATEEADRQMCDDLIDEYLWMGFAVKEIVELFKNPFYLAVHRIWKEKGEAAVLAMVEKRLAAWRGGSKA